jgi:hypothetical protein
MQTEESPDRRADHALEGNLEAARRLFCAVGHRDREGIMAIYDEKIVINELCAMAESTADRRVRFATDWATGEPAFQLWDMRGFQPCFIAQGDHVVALWRQKR